MLVGKFCTKKFSKAKSKTEGIFVGILPTDIPKTPSRLCDCTALDTVVAAKRVCGIYVPAYHKCDQSNGEICALTALTVDPAPSRLKESVYTDPDTRVFALY